MLINMLRLPCVGVLLVAAGLILFIPGPVLLNCEPVCASRFVCIGTGGGDTVGRRPPPPADSQHLRARRCYIGTSPAPLFFLNARSPLLTSRCRSNLAVSYSGAELSDRKGCYETAQFEDVFACEFLLPHGGDNFGILFAGGFHAVWHELEWDYNPGWNSFFGGW